MKTYYLEHCTEIRLSQKKYHSSKKGKKSLDKARQKERDNLTDNYIRQALYTNIYNSTGEKIVRKDIPQEMIEQYRKVLTVKRELKNENQKTIKKNRRQKLRDG